MFVRSHIFLFIYNFVLDCHLTCWLVKMQLKILELGSNPKVFILAPWRLRVQQRKC